MFSRLPPLVGTTSISPSSSRAKLRRTPSTVKLRDCLESDLHRFVENILLESYSNYSFSPVLVSPQQHNIYCAAEEDDLRVYFILTAGASLNKCFDYEIQTSTFALHNLDWIFDMAWEYLTLALGEILEEIHLLDAANPWQLLWAKSSAITLQYLEAAWFKLLKRIAIIPWRTPWSSLRVIMPHVTANIAFYQRTSIHGLRSSPKMVLCLFHHRFISKHPETYQSFPWCITC